jgi:hypothetical protein
MELKTKLQYSTKETSSGILREINSSNDAMDSTMKGLEKKTIYVNHLSDCSISSGMESEDAFEKVLKKPIDKKYLKGIDFKLLSKKCGSIGRIESLKEFNALYYGKVAENQCVIILTFNTLSEINSEVRRLFKSTDESMFYSTDAYQNKMMSTLILLNLLNQ